MMENAALSAADPFAVEKALREDLAQGDSALASAGPILRHLLSGGDPTLFNDEAVARVRGMLDDVARQLLDERADAAQADDRAHPAEQVAELAALLAERRALLTHIHATALEGQLTDRLHARINLDPVNAPLLQALIAAPEPATAGEAMALLAAQTRFIQGQRRMQLPLAELPGDLLHHALLVLRAFTGDADGSAAKAEAAVRARYDESRTRIGRLTRIVTALGGGASAALSLSHAGVALFLTALGLGSGNDRDLAVLSTGEGQMARLVLALRACGLKQPAVEEQFLALHPDHELPPGFDMLGADRAAALLAQTPGWPGS